MRLKLFLVTVLLTFTGSAFAGTLDDVRKAGQLVCGVSTGLPGFSAVNSKKEWEGLDVDVCRAISAAIFGDADKVKYIPLTAKERFTALSSGEVDVLSRNTTWTLTRDATLGLNFTHTTYYDGQGFLVKKSLGVKSAKDLDGAAVCTQSGTTTELNLQTYFAANGMGFKSVGYETSAQTKEGFERGRCDVLTSDASQLAAIRTQLKDPNSVELLPEIISKEPLGPVVRQGDDEWFNVVRWSVFALLNSEELGVNSKNVKSLANSKDPKIGRLLGSIENTGGSLGLDKRWAYNIIAKVGNYGEIFDRNVGKDSKLNLSRGLNALWTAGGIQYAPPIK